MKLDKKEWHSGFFLSLSIISCVIHDNRFLLQYLQFLMRIFGIGSI